MRCASSVKVLCGGLGTLRRGSHTPPVTSTATNPATHSRQHRILAGYAGGEKEIVSIGRDLQIALLCRVSCLDSPLWLLIVPDLVRRVIRVSWGTGVPGYFR